MFNITKEQIDLLRPYINDIDNLINQEINEFLLVLDDVILDSLDKDEEATELTRKLDKLYDAIYSAN